MNDRIYMIGCALTGLCAHPQTEAPDDVVGRTAVQVADAALKAAGEPSGDSGQLTNEARAWAVVAEIARLKRLLEANDEQ